MVKVGGAMDHPTQPVPAQTVNLSSMQSALTCLRKITDAGDGRQANVFMRAIINNLWISIGSAPNPILSARYPHQACRATFTALDQRVSRTQCELLPVSPQSWTCS